MRYRVWTVSPFFFVFSLTIFAMAFLSLPNIVLFLFEGISAIIIAGLVGFHTFNFQRYIKNIIKHTVNSLGDFDSDAISKLPIPTVVVGGEKDIIYFNSAFMSKVSNEADYTGESISQFIPGKTLEQILKHKGIDVAYGNRRYTVFGVKGQYGTVLYFLEDTYYKLTTFEYIESRPAVAMVIFDNKDEMIKDSIDGQDAQITGAIEQELQKWASSTSGFLRKLSNGRYLIMMEERNLRTFIANKFKILEDIREIKFEDNKIATISIGIGRGGNTLKECELWARKALDMALGRGGDQVAIKQGDSYSFFGGVSKATEKRDKVKTRVIASSLIEQIALSDQVFIMGHKFSDLDSLGASLGLWSAIARGQQRRPAFMVADRAQTLAESLIESIEQSGNTEAFISPFEALNKITSKSLLIIVDTHCEEMLESHKLYLAARQVVVIDHHRITVNHIKDAIVFYNEPCASSASEMVTELISYFGENVLMKKEAEALLAGIMLDTKNFTAKTGARTFEAAAFLKRRNADTAEAKELFANSIETYQEKYALISKAEIIGDYAIACAGLDYSNIRLVASQVADELLDIKGVRTSFVLFPFGESIFISARSMGEVNVQVIMEKLGGGGHQTMAGAELKGYTTLQAKQMLTEVINKFRS